MPGKGRGATGFAGGVSRDESSDASNRMKEPNLEDTNYDEFSGYQENLFGDTVYDDDDRAADHIYDLIDDRMDTRRRSRREANLRNEILKARSEKASLQQQFSDVRRALATVSREEWESIPDIGDYSLKHKQKKQQQLTPAPDSLLACVQAQRSINTVSGSSTPIGAFNGGSSTPLLRGGLQTPLGLRTPMSFNGLQTPLGLRTPTGASTPCLNDLGEARGTVLSVKLDKVMDSVDGQTVMNPKGYLTDLNSLSLKSESDLQDIKKARTLLKSVIHTNPNHAPGWIAAARVEEIAGRLSDARELMAKCCAHCPTNEDVWLEAARLERPAGAKAVLAQAVRHMPNSVRLWIDAAARETDKETRKLVLKKALEFIPNSIRLWKEAVSLEDERGARLLLARAVECVPTSVDMWLALARLCSYEEAKKVLNTGRRKIPTSPIIWIAACKLEETQGHDKTLDKIVSLCLESCATHGAVLERDAWLKIAEEAEKGGHPKTAKAVVKATMRIGVEERNMKKLWREDAEGLLARGLNYVYTHTRRKEI
eukprot:GHVR01113452.1.p1 GENE.GHVR01113452.1~~GHVR01113452.1.p1  ORF type:complete len:540 (+),score=155.76 GHVR01113452.1:98-1717(+)